MHTFRSGILGVLALFLVPGSAIPQEGGRSPYAEESLVYDISFLWFDRLAEGELSFSADDRPGTYRAVLDARTRGIAALVSGNRAKRFISIMEAQPGGGLRPVSHESHDIRGGAQGLGIKRYLFDHRRGEVRYQSFRGGELLDERTVPIDAENPPADLLTALYNFRAGVYGRPVPGEPLVIPAFNRRGDSDIVVEALTPEERAPFPFPEGGAVCRIALDPEIFDTGGGDVFVWFNEAGEPAVGLVENVKGLGDVRGAIR